MDSQTRGIRHSGDSWAQCRPQALMLVLLAGFALLAFSTAQASATGNGSISGTLTDSTGTPVFYICVEAYDSDGTQVSFNHSNASGNYTLSGLATGDYRVKFR